MTEIDDAQALTEEVINKVSIRNALTNATSQALRAIKLLGEALQSIPDFCCLVRKVAEYNVIKEKAIREMSERGIGNPTIRYFVPSRVYHLATRHKNPRVRKKNQKRIRKILYEK